MKKIFIGLFILGGVFLYIKDNNGKIVSRGISSYLSDKCVVLSKEMIDQEQFYLMNDWNKLPASYKKSGKYFPFRQVSLSSRNKDILLDFNLFRSFSNKDGHLLVNMYFPQVAFSIDEEGYKKLQEDRCGGLDSIVSSMVYQKDMCISYYNLMDGEKDYYKIIGKSDEKLILEGIYHTSYKDKIISTVSKDPLFNFYYPQREYPFNISYQATNKLVEKFSCPEKYELKFKEGDCIAELDAKIVRVKHSQGIYELRSKTPVIGRSIAGESLDGFGKMSDFYKMRRQQGFLEIYFYDQDKFTKKECSSSF